MPEINYSGNPFPSRRIGKTFAMSSMMTKYRDEAGSFYMVSMGLGGNCWMTMRIKHGKSGQHRVCSKDLPVREGANGIMEAQRDLDAWAIKKHLQMVA